MGQLKSYTIFDSLFEYKGIFAGFAILDSLFPLFFKNMIDPIGFATVGSMLVTMTYFLVRDYKNAKIVLEYIKSHEPELNKKYIYHNGYGHLRVYFRDFTIPEIEKMMNSPVSASFVECYRLPVKVASAAIFFISLSLILKWIY
ncbi:MAG TPA: hypothetical protein VK154_14605 [Chitinophagales bacterium]|nr:hypothetical protein [Chitinophagales bacterium]